MLDDTLATALAGGAAIAFYAALGDIKNPLPKIVRLLLSVPVLLACVWLFNQVSCIAVTSPSQWWQ